MSRFTIVYVTCRQDPQINWFFDSLNKQATEKFSLVVVDLLMHQRRLPAPPPALFDWIDEFWYMPAKPSVWQGPHRKTAVDFFSAANARNTGLCFCRNTDGHVVYVDDCSVLAPNWFKVVRWAADNGLTVAGTYEKVINLRVTEGLIDSYDSKPDGGDYRKWQSPRPISGRFLIGCTMAIPVRALLKINGWPEFLCDGMGYEDCITGEMLEKVGCTVWFHPDLKIYEDEGLHDQNRMRRIDPGVSPHDKSHAMRQVALTRSNFAQHFGGGFKSIANLREAIIKGGAGNWPIPEEPTVEWFTGIPLDQFHTYRHP